MSHVISLSVGDQKPEITSASGTTLTADDIDIVIDDTAVTTPGDAVRLLEYAIRFIQDNDYPSA
jgi:hypothetical protein|tara:strand:- start:298 stop:489 length:192 start_codon:yes stop_codon:yes gene_type:complete